MPELKSTSKTSNMKQPIDDFTSVIVVSLIVALFHWSQTFSTWILLFIIWEPYTAIFFLLYYCWCYYDRNTPKMGGKKSHWFCDLRAVKSLRYYFPCRLIKTANLPSGRNYILAHHPHGLVPFHVLPTFLADKEEMAALYPGIEMQFVTASISFYIPFLREFFLAIGGVSCSKSSFTYALKNSSSKALIVLPGGALEMSYSSPGSNYKIIRRKGFVRLALATGSSLVPVFTFGEMNAWSKLILIRGWRPLSKIVKFITHVPMNIYVPLGIGFLPKRSPLNTIVGAPISVPKVENPSEELINEYYEKFYQALQDLFEQHKHEYDVAGEKAKLIIVQDSQ